MTDGQVFEQGFKFEQKLTAAVQRVEETFYQGRVATSPDLSACVVQSMKRGNGHDRDF